jgi:hypothetical protein
MIGRRNAVNVIWIEMPVVHAGDSGAVGPKYAVAGNAVVVYRNDRAYVGLTGGDVTTALLRHPDVHPLSRAEQERLGRESVVHPAAVEHLVTRAGRHGHPLVAAADRVGLGDIVSATARRLGIPECRGCARRHRALNRLTVRRSTPLRQT